MHNIREGDLYKILNIDNQKFEIKYGYYEERDRYSKYNDPIPIFPDFIKEPKYNSSGFMFVTKMQDVCKHFVGGNYDSCCNCKHFKEGDDLIGICDCPNNKK